MSMFVGTAQFSSIAGEGNILKECFIWTPPGDQAVWHFWRKGKGCGLIPGLFVQELFSQLLIGPNNLGGSEPHCFMGGALRVNRAGLSQAGQL